MLKKARLDRMNFDDMTLYHLQNLKSFERNITYYVQSNSSSLSKYGASNIPKYLFMKSKQEDKMNNHGDWRL